MRLMSRIRLQIFLGARIVGNIGIGAGEVIVFLALRRFDLTGLYAAAAKG